MNRRMYLRSTLSVLTTLDVLTSTESIRFIMCKYKRIFINLQVEIKNTTIMKFKVFAMALAAAALLGAVSCNKESEPVPEDNAAEEIAAGDISVAEAVDILTKSITKEDLEGLSLFLKSGNTDGFIYLEIAQEGTAMVSGEVGLAQGEKRKVVSLDLSLFGAMPLKGTVDVVELGVNLAAMKLFRKWDNALEKYLEKANEAIDVVIYGGLYYVAICLVEDTETGAIGYEPFLLSSMDPGTRISIMALLSSLGM